MIWASTWNLHHTFPLLHCYVYFMFYFFSLLNLLRRQKYASWTAISNRNTALSPNEKMKPRNTPLTTLKKWMRSRMMPHLVRKCLILNSPAHYAEYFESNWKYMYKLWFSSCLNFHSTNKISFHSSLNFWVYFVGSESHCWNTENSISYFYSSE